MYVCVFCVCELGHDGVNLFLFAKAEKDKTPSVDMSQ